MQKKRNVNFEKGFLFLKNVRNLFWILNTDTGLQVYKVQNGTEKLMKGMDTHNMSFV